jgi:AAA+ ATPase superfamily predicted ATPase
MPLFDLHPKESPAALFGRDQELQELVGLVDEGRWVVVLGPRMVGKTSLIRAAGARIRRPTVYVNLWGARGTSGIVEAFVHGLNSNRSLLARVRRTVRRIEGVSLGPAGISIAAPRRPLRTVWELLDAIGDEAGRSVIELDEVQEVAASSGPFLKMLANLFNAHPGVSFIFSGSRFGLIRTLLEPRAESPLFGRTPAVLRLEQFPPATSVEFLDAGLREYKRRAPRPELVALCERTLDGLPGWLTLFGNHVAVEHMDLDAAEAATRSEGMKVARTELAHFTERREAYVYWDALRLLSVGANWTELRDRLSARRGARVNDNTVRNLLESLQSAEFVAKVGERYHVRDPMMRALVEGPPPRRGPA